MTNEIKERVESYKQYLGGMTHAVSTVEAERRAMEFLHAQAMITEFRHILSEEKVKYTTVQSAVYAEELSKCTGKTVTENKVTVEANPQYTQAREDLESLENDINYLKAFYEIYKDAHILYRQMSKQTEYS